MILISYVVTILQELRNNTNVDANDDDSGSDVPSSSTESSYGNSERMHIDPDDYYSALSSDNQAEEESRIDDVSNNIFTSSVLFLDCYSVL